MKKIFNFKSLSVITAILTSTMSIAANEADKTEIIEKVLETSTPIYETLGVSSGTLSLIMLAFTVILLLALYSVAKTASNVLKSLSDKSKKAGLLIAIGLFSTTTFAADGSESTGIIFSNTAFWTILITDLCIIAMIVYFAVFSKKIMSSSEKGKQPTSIFSSFTNAVDIDKEDTILLDHEYDGIRELDNDLPPWWKYGFYITIVWAIIYYPYYHYYNTDGLQTGEYLAEMAEGEKQVAAYKAANPNMVNAETVTLLTDADAIAKGKEIFTTNCVACHAGNGGGGIGPNLTDENWIYNGDIKGVFTTVSEGAENGMIAWKDILNPEKIQAVASFVLSLPKAKGGKEPQGEHIFKK